MTSNRRTPTSHRELRPPGLRGPGRVRPADRAVTGAARLAGAAIRATGRGQGATLPGLLAEKFAPGVTARLAARLEQTVLVSGTNGKTTTTAMLAAALAGEGRRVVSNRAGSNLYRGLATALLGADPAARDAVLEVDEAVLPRAIQELRPRLVVLLNLTRDQLDRNHAPCWYADAVPGSAATTPSAPAVAGCSARPSSAATAAAAAAGPRTRRPSGSSGWARASTCAASAPVAPRGCRSPPTATRWTPPWRGRRRPGSAPTPQVP
jgi:hypothetical protein